MPAELRTMPLHPAASPAATRPGHGPAADGAMDAVARRAAGIGGDAAELEGLIEDLAAESGGRARAARELASGIDEVAQASRSIDEVSRRAAGKVAQARASLGRIADGVYGAMQALRQVAAATQDIGQVALQTRLVASSASVEAKRAGSVGHGFAVVAETVGDLAAKVEQSVALIARTVSRLDAQVGELAVELSTDTADGEHSGLRRALAQAETDIAWIAQTAQRSLHDCTAAADRMRAQASDAAGAAHALDGARATVRRLLGASEAASEPIADGGHEAGDTPSLPR